MYETFKTWEDVLAHVDAGKWLHYHAPMDLRPTSVAVVKRYKNGKIKLDPGTDADPFVADTAHLSRMRRLVR